MNTSPSGQTSVIRDQRAALRQMTSQQLLQLGTDEVVYLRSSIREGKPLFVVYGADGQPLVWAATVDAAAEMAAEHGLAFVSVH